MLPVSILTMLIAFTPLFCYLVIEFTTRLRVKGSLSSHDISQFLKHYLFLSVCSRLSLV